MKTQLLKAILIATAASIVPAWAFDMRQGNADHRYTVRVGVQDALRALGWRDGMPLPAIGMLHWQYEMKTSLAIDSRYYHLSLHLGEHAGDHWSGGVCVPRPASVFASA